MKSSSNQNHLSESQRITLVPKLFGGAVPKTEEEKAKDRIKRSPLSKFVKK